MSPARMQKYKESSKDLWRGGMPGTRVRSSQSASMPPDWRSQPPWLLAMKNDFLDLGDEPSPKMIQSRNSRCPNDPTASLDERRCLIRWNCNSLGRENMVYEEAGSKTKCEAALA